MSSDSDPQKTLNVAQLYYSTKSFSSGLTKTSKGGEINPSLINAWCILKPSSSAPFSLPIPILKHCPQFVISVIPCFSKTFCGLYYLFL